MIIDAHTHVWPDAVAAKALAGTVKGLAPMGDGTVAGLTASMARSGVDRSVVLGVANNGEQVPKVQRFVSSLDEQSFVGFGSVHPDLSVEENVASLRSAGVQGIKVHPIFQGISLDDPRMYAIFDALEPGFPIVVHVGAGGTPEQTARATPLMMRDLARAFPHLAFIACHFGGYHQFDDALDVICGEQVLVDTSWPPGLVALDPGAVRAFILRHGPERVVFSSDWPMADQLREVETVANMGLGKEATELILGGNMERLLRV